DWHRLASEHPYRVVALEPNPSVANDEVTHPHVNHDTLCEGEGRIGIRRALAAGRLYDFFILVDRVLHTYSRGQAFVELDHWQGTPCYDCGSHLDPDESYSCSRCDETVCFDCSRCCTHCGQCCCSGCSDYCALCDETNCSGCLKHFEECQDQVCHHC